MHKGITIARTLAMFFRQPRAHTYHAVSDEVVERWNTAGYVSPTSGLAEDCYLQTSRKYHVPFVVSDIAMWCHVVFRVEHGPVNADAV